MWNMCFMLVLVPLVLVFLVPVWETHLSHTKTQNLCRRFGQRRKTEGLPTGGTCDLLLVH